MRSLLYGLAFAGIMAAQTSDAPSKALDSTLSSLRNTGGNRSEVSQQLSSEISALADREHRPRRATVERLSRDLTHFLAGKNLTADTVSQTSRAIANVLHSAGTSTSDFLDSVERMREALVAAGAGARESQVIADELTALGKEVRGPEGAPVEPPRQARQKR